MKLAISVQGLAARLASMRAGRIRAEAIAAALAELARRARTAQPKSPPAAVAPADPTPPRS
jgi:hypothetical protein